MFQLNFFGILILLALGSIFIILPSYIIQNIWNASYATEIDRDMTIALWQASLLWGALVSLLYATGLFQFKLDFKTLESIDPESISDPELREEVEKLQLKAQETQNSEEKPKAQDDDYNI